MAYRATDVYSGEDVTFWDREDAKRWVRSRRDTLHTDLCIKRAVPQGNCLCKTTSGKETCAAHDYAQTASDHEMKDCAWKESVFVAEVDIQ